MCSSISPISTFIRMKDLPKYHRSTINHNLSTLCYIQVAIKGQFPDDHAFFRRRNARRVNILVVIKKKPS
ncbi:hypothetical protein Hanom_Chr11g01038491 [Helianthus anomalus]